MQDANGDAVEVAVVSAGLGELDEAFLWLERAIEPIFTELHQDPRSERVREALGI